MPQRPWSFLINTFESNTRNNYKKALSLGEDHRARLHSHSADPEIAALIATYDPVLASYKTVDMNLQAVLGTYEGKTLTVEELFGDLSKTKLPFWEGQIHAVYPAGTAAERALFPNKRKPFNEGTYEQRISAIKVLGDKCALDAPLVAVSADILGFWAVIESARLSQQTDGEAAADGLREMRENARITLCDELYGNLGALMQKYRTDPTEVEQYYDLTYLRESSADTDEFIIAPLQVINLMDDAVPGEVTGIKIKNTSLEDVPVKVYFATSSSQIPSGTVFTIQKGETKVLNESDLGTIQPFVNAYNDDGHTATFEVTGL